MDGGPFEIPDHAYRTIHESGYVDGWRHANVTIKSLRDQVERLRTVLGKTVVYILETTRPDNAHIQLLRDIEEALKSKTEGDG